MDAKNMLLQGTLKEEIYMLLPPGHAQKDNINLVCKLRSQFMDLNNPNEHGMTS
jgi:hypothetical protein